MSFYRTFLFCLLLPCVCHARLGETVAELTKRYGPPKYTSNELASSEGRTYTIGQRLSFQSEDWSITCVVIEDRCAKISYHKQGSWSEEQALVFLNANSQGSTWTKQGSKPKAVMLTHWKRQDSASASFSLNTFVITHPAYERAVSTAKSKAKAESNQLPKKF